MLPGTAPSRSINLGQENVSTSNPLPVELQGLGVIDNTILLNSIEQRLKQLTEIQLGMLRLMEAAFDDNLSCNVKGDL